MTPAAFQSIRERAGHTRASLAAYLRVTPRTVQMIESGQRNAGGPVTVLMEMLSVRERKV